ncbi:MAG: fimbrial protein [Pseudomonas sp.]|uniref:fimbrial protein n=1 Tax=Pseudomonas sp. TaxID=306 RepID=UPI003D6DE987
MKRTLFQALVACISILAATAHAADGTINFKGSIIGTTCRIAVNGTVAPAAATVTLPPVGDSLLNAVGKMAIPTNFDIMLSNCTATGKASAYFEAGPGVDTISGHLKNTGTAANVDLQLLDRNNSNAAIRAGQTQAATSRINFVGGAATLPYTVQYYALGVATVGTVTGSVTYSIIYE